MALAMPLEAAQNRALVAEGEPVLLSWFICGIASQYWVLGTRYSPLATGTKQQLTTNQMVPHTTHSKSPLHLAARSTKAPIPSASTASNCRTGVSPAPALFPLPAQ